MALTLLDDVDAPHTAPPVSLTVRRQVEAPRVTVVETHEIRSPASSITKLGIVRFTIPEEPPVPGDGLASGSGVVELPSFTDEETSRPTVQMPPLVERGRPVSIDEAFDPGGEGGEGGEAGESVEASPDARSRPRSSTLPGVAPAAVPPVPSPVVHEETLPIGEITRAPAPPRPSQQLAAGEADIATEEMPPLRRYAWWPAAITGGALAALAGVLGLATAL